MIAPGSTGPGHQEPVDLLYIDSSHDRGQTIEEVRAWQPHLCPGAPVLFDDYTHPDYPGVREAIEDLGLEGEQRGTLFVHWTRRRETAVSGDSSRRHSRPPPEPAHQTHERHSD